MTTESEDIEEDVVSEGNASGSSLSSLVENGKYKGWLLDQFGVLHDGLHPYDHALDLVRVLAEKEDTKLVILTNSARRAPHTLNRLEKMGFHRSWFEGVATSGDVAHRVLSLPPGTCDPKLLPEDHPLWSDINPFQDDNENENENEVKTQDTSINRHRRPRRCLHFTWKEFDLENGIDLTSLDIEPVTCPSQADFILVHWFDCIAMEGNKELQKVDETQ